MTQVREFLGLTNLEGIVRSVCAFGFGLTSGYWLFHHGGRGWIFAALVFVFVYSAVGKEDA